MKQHRPEPERTWQEFVIEAAHLRGWVVAHFRPARTTQGWRTPVAADGAGFVDLVLVHPRRGWVLFVECKTDTGRLSPEQRAWQEAIVTASLRSDDARFVHDVWRPRDVTRVLAILRDGPGE